MLLIITGLVFALIGWGNLAIGRLHRERPNARLTRGLGFVGIVVGALTLMAGISQIAGLMPAPPPQP